MRTPILKIFNVKWSQYRTLMIALATVALIPNSATAQTRQEVTSYKKDTLELVLQCPVEGTDYNANIAKCIPIGQKLKDRHASTRIKWRWYEDRLQWRLVALHGRLTQNFFKRDSGRSADTCLHVEKAWLGLNRISVKGRVEINDFLKMRTPLHKVVGLCRKERNTPEWGAPMALSNPSPKEE